MSRRAAARNKSKLDRLRALPWLALFEGAVIVRGRWRALSAKDRARLRSLARDSGWGFRGLSTKQRAELGRILGKLEFKRTARELVWLARRGKRRRSRWRGARA